MMMPVVSLAITPGGNPRRRMSSKQAIDEVPVMSFYRMQAPWGDLLEQPEKTAYHHVLSDPSYLPGKRCWRLSEDISLSSVQTFS